MTTFVVVLKRWCLFLNVGVVVVSSFMVDNVVASETQDIAEIRARWVSAISADNSESLTALLEQSKAYKDLALLPLWKLYTSNGKSALMVACKVGDEKLAMQLVEKGSNFRHRTATHGTAFMFAVLGDQQALALWLHDLGADINAVGSNGWTSVMIASAKGLSGTLEWLLSEGADAQTPDVYGFSPLMRAADNGHTEAVNLLLTKAKADVQWQDELNNSALHYAVAGDHQDIVQLLLDSDASTTLKNTAGLSALDLAMDAVKDITASKELKERREAVLKSLQLAKDSG